LHSKIGQLKFSKFVMRFSYFFKLCNPISAQTRVSFSKLPQLKVNFKGFRFFFKIFKLGQFRLKFQRLYFDLFIKASLPQLRGFFKRKYNRNTKFKRYNYPSTKNRAVFAIGNNTNKFIKDTRSNNKFIKGYD